MDDKTLKAIEIAFKAGWVAGYYHVYWERDAVSHAAVPGLINGDDIEYAAKRFLESVQEAGLPEGR